jgi:hypothetical protein
MLVLLRRREPTQSGNAAEGPSDSCGTAEENHVPQAASPRGEHPLRYALRVRLPLVALALVSAALGASSCIFLVDEAAESGAGGTGGASSTSTSGTTSGGGATTTSSAGGAGGAGGDGFTVIEEQGTPISLAPGPVNRVARTPISNEHRLLLGGGNTTGSYEFILHNPSVPQAVPAKLTSSGGPGIAFVQIAGKPFAIEPLSGALAYRSPSAGQAPVSDDIGCPSAHLNIIDVASVPQGMVAARCGTHVFVVPLLEGTNPDVPDWGMPVGITTAANGTKVKLRIANGDDSGSFHVLWDDDVTLGSGVRFSSCSSSAGVPECSGGGERRFQPTSLDDFGYSAEADTVFARVGGTVEQLWGAPATAGGVRLFDDYAVHAMTVRGHQLAFAATSTIRADKTLLAVCFVDGDFTEAARGPEEPAYHCAFAFLDQDLPPHIVVLTEDHVYTVTAAGGGGPAEPKLRRYLLQ